MKINIKRGKMRTPLRVALAALALLLVCSAATFALYGALIPPTVSCFSDEDVPSYLGTTFESDESVFTDGESAGGVVELSRGQYKLFGAIPVRSVNVAKLTDTKVYVGGVPFGIKFYTKGATVVGFDGETSNVAYKAGLRLYDTVTKINGREISGISDLLGEIEGSAGKPVKLTYTRAGKESTVSVTPKYSESEGRYSLGLLLKDSGAGIGTVTFVLPDGTFGGLGHGICESDTGELTKIDGGSVLGVTVNGIEKGKRGEPGELKGYFNSSKVGSITENNECGIFGIFAQIPEAVKGKMYSLGLKNELKEGAATLLCTLDDNTRCEYSIEISNINRSAEGNKCFTVRITDGRLIGATGGIVQGMSGSPIIQNGKLVGAVTHVLINDPATGYGIFVENMLTQMSTAEKNAA